VVTGKQMISNSVYLFVFLAHWLCASYFWCFTRFYSFAFAVFRNRSLCWANTWISGFQKKPDRFQLSAQVWL